MNSLHPPVPRLAKLEVRYGRSFLMDLRSLEPAASGRVQQFVFGEFLQLPQLSELPGFHRLADSDIFYCFFLDEYIISLEVVGQLVKFLRVLPKPSI